jgi:hypothetical protein
MEDASESVNEDDDDPLAALDRAEAQAAQAAADPEADDVNNRAAAELRAYLTAPYFPRKNDDNEWSNPMEWWRENHKVYPMLGRLAKIYLSVQAISAPSERIFSAASRMITKQRNRLDPIIAGKLLFVSRNWDWYFQLEVSMKLQLKKIDQTVVRDNGDDKEDEVHE